MKTINFLSTWFLVFIIYSFVGWMMELTVMYLEKHRLGNRGFLIGPIVPIYGVGAVLLGLVLGRTESMIAIFCVSVVGSALLEYLTSYVMEKLFHVRWWDYSHEPFNLNGRICLQTLILFGIFGIIIINITNPLILSLLGRLNPIVLNIVALILFIIFLADLFGSLYLITRFRVAAGTVEKDATEEISQHIREVLMERGLLSRRLVKAFPDLEVKKSSPRKRKTTTKPNHKTKHPKSSDRQAD